MTKRERAGDYNLVDGNICSLFLMSHLVVFLTKTSCYSTKIFIELGRSSCVYAAATLPTKLPFQTAVGARLKHKGFRLIFQVVG